MARPSRPIPIARMQAVDQRLGRAVCALLSRLRPLRRRPDGPPRRIALLKFWGLGSLQLLTPAVRTLRARHPGAQLDLVTLAENASFARGLGVFDRVVTLDLACRRWSGVAARLLGLVRRLRRERYDKVYDLEFFTRASAAIAFLSGAPEVAGFAAPEVERGRLHDETAPFNRYRHVAANFLALAAGPKAPPAEPTWRDLEPFRVGAAHHAELDAALEAAAAREGVRLGRERPLVVLNPNAGRLSLERRWPAESFAALARRLTAEGCAVALIGAAPERAHVGAIARAAGGAVLDLAGALSIGALCALFERAEAVVSNDSGPMHLAAALGAPTIGLFGPETPVMYAPLGPWVRVLYRPPACSPCINVHENKLATCIHGRAECLVAIEVEAVLAEVRAALGRAPGRVLAHPAARRAAGEERCASSS